MKKIFESAYYEQYPQIPVNKFSTKNYKKTWSVSKKPRILRETDDFVIFSYYIPGENKPKFVENYFLIIAHMWIKMKSTSNFVVFVEKNNKSKVLRLFSVDISVDNVD